MYLLLILLGCNPYAEYHPVVEIPVDKSNCIYVLPSNWEQIPSPFKDHSCFTYGAGMRETSWGGPYCVPNTVQMSDEYL